MRTVKYIHAKYIVTQRKDTGSIFMNSLAVVRLLVICISFSSPDCICKAKDCTTIVCFFVIKTNVIFEKWLKEGRLLKGF